MMDCLKIIPSMFFYAYFIIHILYFKLHIGLFGIGLRMLFNAYIIDKVNILLFIMYDHL